MPYYNNNKTLFLIDGIEVYMTEMEAERYQSTHPDADIQRPSATPAPGRSAADDFLDCTCLPDPPEGTAPLCPSCRKFFESLLEDE